MQKFDRLTGVAAPLPIVNIDTDMIIPKDYLKTIKRTGLGVGLFAGLRYNDDGSIDLYVGAAPPSGWETNYLKTIGDDGWFVYFRLYAPEQPFFDKTFTLSDFERLD